MDRRDFAYELPAELIAQAPLPDRSGSRLLVLDGAAGTRRDAAFRDLPDLLAAGDLLIFNDTRVVPARLAGRKATGGRVELLLERPTGPAAGWFQIRASKSPRAGSELSLAGGARARVVARDSDLFHVELDRELEPFLAAHGRIPLPPYISREADAADAERYQTVFAARPGAVAAPTAGLHFDAGIFARLAERGIGHDFLTLHVGAGTFAPLRTEQIESHTLHAERVTVSQALCDRIEATRAAGGRVIACGTTVVRALETAARDRSFGEFHGETRLFIYPGFRFQTVDAIVTNFHLPESSLLMLVAAFAGQQQTLDAYRYAVEQRYRFFSYGDAMLVWPGSRAKCVSS